MLTPARCLTSFSNTQQWTLVGNTPVESAIASEGLSLLPVPMAGCMISFGGYNGRYHNAVHVYRPEGYLAAAGGLPPQLDTPAAQPPAAAPTAAAPPAANGVAQAQASAAAAAAASGAAEYERKIAELEAARREAAAAREAVAHEVAIMRRQLDTAQGATAEAEKVGWVGGFCEGVCLVWCLQMGCSLGAAAGQPAFSDALSHPPSLFFVTLLSRRRRRRGRHWRRSRAVQCGWRWSLRRHASRYEVALRAGCICRAGHLVPGGLYSCSCGCTLLLSLSLFLKGANLLHPSLCISLFLLRRMEEWRAPQVHPSVGAPSLTSAPTASLLGCCSWGAWRSWSASCRSTGGCA